jgi:pterin-4a-carbinolamine dehydratase
MRRTLLAVLSVFAWLLSPSTAQEITREQFQLDFSKALEIGDDKAADRAMKRGTLHAGRYYEDLFWEKDAGKPEAAAKCVALQASWKRCFDGSDTLEQLDRWCATASNQMRQQLQKCRDQSFTIWRDYNEHVTKDLKKADFAASFQAMMGLARQAEAIGHNLEIAELWGLASVIVSQMPDKTIADRRDGVFATEQMLAARKGWNFAFDEHYIRSAEWMKGEKAKIEADEKAGDKRKTEGYDANAKGVDSLVMPNVAEAKHALKFEALPGWEELDYGSKTHPVPAFWWMASTEKVGSNRKLDWFHSRDTYLHRTGASKFVVSDSSEPKNGVEVDVSPKGKVSTFWLDADKKRPYAMVFWIGSDREFVNEAEQNLSAGDNVANVYYRSASSWKATIGADTVTLYDDSADGVPGLTDPFGKGFYLPTLGAHDVEKGTPAPLLDSMRVNKGPRVPCSEFVKLATGWVHLRKGPGDDVGVRPLNPEYVKTGKIKLVWNGPKPSAPVQLVVQGEGDYKTALFDVAGGKEIEVPAADYKVIWGRIMNGKGPRAQIASLFGGDSKPFTVEAGKTFELKMGAPFTLTWNRRGDATATIDALKILLHEASGCVLTELHGISLACEVLAAKEADGKGAKVVGKFVRFTDPELAVEAQKKHNNMGAQITSFPMPEGYRNGELVLTVKLPADGMKLALVIKKHPLFGEVKPVWQ